MAMNRNMTATAIAAMAIVGVAPRVHGDVVVPFDASGWVVHNGTGITLGGSLTSPTVAGDPATIMAPLSSAVTLASEGDFIQLKANIAMAARTGTGMNVLNTQLRFGLFKGPTGPVVGGGTPDTPNLGFVVQYSNGNGAIPNIRGYGTTSTAGNSDPFDSSLLEPAGTAFASSSIGNVTTDAVNDSLLGTDPTASYLLKITNVGGKLNILGSIIGGAYSQSFNAVGVTTSAFPTNGPFTLNRAGFFLGNNVNAVSGVTFSDVEVLTGNSAAVPESRFGMLAVALAAGGVTIGLRLHRSLHRRRRALV